MKKEWKKQRVSARCVIRLYAFLSILLFCTTLSAQVPPEEVEVIHFSSSTTSGWTGTEIEAVVYHPSYGDTLFVMASSLHGTFYQPPFLSGRYEGDIVLPNVVSFFAEQDGEMKQHNLCPSYLKDLNNHVHGVPGISSIYIPSSITIIYDFKCDPNTHTITVDTGNCCYASLDGVLYSKDTTKLIAYPPAKDDVSFICPSTVEIIEEDACRSSKMKHVVLPSEMEYIYSSAFIGSCIESVVLPEKIENENIGEAFSGTALKRVEIPDRWEWLDRAFMNCKQLEYVRIGRGVKEMASPIFNGDSALRVIDCMSEEPPQFVDYEFSDDRVMADLLFDSITVYVPCGSGEAYRNSKWGEHFSNIVERCSGIASPAAFELTVSPNPTNDVLHIAATAEISTLRLYDEAGRLLQECPYSPQLSLARLPQGLYLLQAQSPDGHTVTKRIIKR